MQLSLILLQPDSTKNPKNAELVAAVKNGSVEKVAEMVDQAIDLDQSVITSQGSLIDEGQVEIIKSLTKHGAKAHESLAQCLFKPENHHVSKELLFHIINHCKDVQTMQTIFLELSRRRPKSPMDLDVLKLMLEHGLPVNGLIEDDKAPLHLAIISDRTDFVTLLLEQGADVGMKTSSGMFTLYLAVLCDEVDIPEILLQNGADVNDKTKHGRTALHEACYWDRPEITTILLYWGADVNALDDKKKTPLSTLDPWKDKNSPNKGAILEMLVQELSRMKHEGRPICRENVNYIRKSKRLKKFFDDQVDELKRLSEAKFYGGYSIYDLLKMRSRKMAFLLKNEDLFEALKSAWKPEAFPGFRHEVADVVGRNLERAMILQYEENKLHQIFKGVLPDLVIFKVAYLSLEYLFFDE